MKEAGLSGLHVNLRGAIHNEATGELDSHLTFEPQKRLPRAEVLGSGNQVVRILPVKLQFLTRLV